MKITCKRWESSEQAETLTVQAVAVYGDTLNIQNGPVEWNSQKSAIGKIDNIKLNGTYLLEFEFQESELRSWLKQFIAADPAYSVQLLAEAHAALLIAGQEHRKNNKRLK
ncbi:hypothetical protein ABIA48_004916 [Pseudomonas sp. S30_BP2TU TE3576]|jgi:hypothetical protein|uniref:hypothetical protein n=1 Tax=Pseudomonas sp. S30_BP2TU TE3576 TaxID=3349329 RepID=UPI003D1FBA46